MADALRKEWGRITPRRWPRDGVPDRPGAWLRTVARNKGLGRLRRGGTYRAKLGELAVMATAT